MPIDPMYLASPIAPSEADGEQHCPWEQIEFRISLMWRKGCVEQIEMRHQHEQKFFGWIAPPSKKLAGFSESHRTSAQARCEVGEFP